MCIITKVNWISCQTTGPRNGAAHKQRRASERVDPFAARPSSPAPPPVPPLPEAALENKKPKAAAKPGPPPDPRLQKTEALRPEVPQPKPEAPRPKPQPP